MKFRLLFVTAAVSISSSYAQVKPPVNKKQKDSVDRNLKEVVVTGEYGPQSLRNSVYRTRVIDGERIRLRAAVNVQQVLSTELGFRFSNDLTLGTSDVTMMGMSGRNVKILLDGVAMVDRGDTRESLNQIDINTIERIEIIDGPLSVSYGSDALAGVINIITRKAGKDALSINARIQEETIGKEYAPFSKDGNHIQHIGISGQNKGFYGIAGLTHNNSYGFNVPLATTTPQQIADDGNRWKPKEQWMANTKLGYGKGDFNIFYRLDYVNEDINAALGYNPLTNIGNNQQYITNRYTNQLQSDYKVNDKLQLNGVLGYTNLQRATKTTVHDFSNGTESLGTAPGQQDVAKFFTTTFRGTAQYKMSSAVAFQPGVEINLDEGSGARINGNPSINDYAFFISSELTVAKGIVLRPGLRFIKNSVYKAPPVIPSFNAKIALNESFDLRLSYANGFRAPALRELYYDFFDASHSIRGNKNLKAEQSDSFTASLSFAAKDNDALNFRSVLSGFYNNIRNRIDYGVDPNDRSVTTLLNVAKYKTTGGTLENTLTWKNFQANLGFSLTGTYNSYSETPELYGESAEFVWTPELNSNLTYTFEKLGATANLAFKYSGKRPFYELNADSKVNLAKAGAYSIADLMFTKRLVKGITLNAGVNNLFDVTALTNTSVTTGGAHSAGGGPIPFGYGRSYVVGLNYNWSKK